MSVPRRIVTGHDASGKSVVLSDTASPKTTDIGTAAFHEIWVTEGMPVQIPASEAEPTDRPIRVGPPANGVMIRFTEMEPGAESPMHRTETLDVGTWANRSDRPVRMVFVLVDGEIGEDVRAAAGSLEFFDQVLD
jgi:hypothetical protein